MNTKDTVKSLHGTLNTLVPDIQNVILRLKKELLDPIKQKVVIPTSTESETQTNPVRPERDIDPLRIHDPLRATNPLRPQFG